MGGTFSALNRGFALSSGFYAGEIITMTTTLVSGTEATFGIESPYGVLLVSGTVPGTVTYVVPETAIYAWYFNNYGPSTVNMVITCSAPAP